MIGSRLGPYDIAAKLGAGGMGEVYRATDTKLKRDVAIKVLPAAFTADKERLARFEREAQLLAQLQHPNIASIYGLEESDGVRALVMELVEGPTLAERLETGSLALAESLSVALQITLALEEAHEKGIVHRDLKPQNIKASMEGKVKVLDFGLAKAMEPGVGTAAADMGRSPTLMNSPTLTAAGTQLGVILGTAAYMAPEQARGGVVDKRADIWAFGVVLHEMLTGRSLFAGPTVSDTLAGVLKTEIDWKSLPSETPSAIRQLLRRCLERNPKNRLHDIADARLVLEDLLAGRGDSELEPAAGPEPIAVRGGSWPARIVWLGIGAALGALAVAGLGRSIFQAPPARPPVVRSLTYSGTSGAASVSADGRFVAFVSDRGGIPRIWLKQVATGEEVALTAGSDIVPVISPDSNSVLFSRVAESGFDLYRVPLVGGEPRRLARGVLPFGVDWTPDGRQIVIARNLERESHLLLIPAEGGEEKTLLKQEASIRAVAWSPDGARLLVMNVPRTNTISSTALATVEIANGATRELHRFPAGSLVSVPRWDGDGALLFAWSPTQAGRGEVLLQRLKIGEAVPLSLFSFSSMPQRLELAGPGALLFDAGGTHQNLVDVNASQGGALGRGLTGGPTLDRQPAFSPDGRRIVFTSDRSGSLDLWSLELDSGAVRRLTFDAADDWDPHWSPDGRHVLWSSNRGGHFEIWIADADASGARQATSNGVDAENPTMSSDGAWIVYSSSNPAAPGIWKARPDGSDAMRLLAGNYSLPELSPKTGWVSAVEAAAGAESPIRVVRLEDGAPVAELTIPGRRRNPGRSRWLPDGRTLVIYGDDEARRAVLFAQPIVPGRDTRSERRVVAVSDEGRVIESFGISPVDGRIVVSAGWTDSDVMLAEGIPGIGQSPRRRGP